MKRKISIRREHIENLNGKIYTKEWKFLKPINKFQEKSNLVKELISLTKDAVRIGVVGAIVVGAFFLGRNSYSPKEAFFDEKYNVLGIDNKYFLESYQVIRPDPNVLDQDMFLFNKIQIIK